MHRKLFRRLLLSIAFISTLALTGCSGYSPEYLIKRLSVKLTGVDRKLPAIITTATLAPIKHVSLATPTPLGTPPSIPEGWQQITPAGLGISFELPAEFAQLEGQPLTWLTSGDVTNGDQRLFGVRVAPLAPMETLETTLLPSSAVIRIRQSYPVNQVEAVKYQLETVVNGQVKGYETDLVLRRGDQAFAFWVSAPNEEGRAALEAVLDQVLVTIK